MVNGLMITSGQALDVSQRSFIASWVIGLVSRLATLVKRFDESWNASIPMYGHKRARRVLHITNGSAKRGEDTSASCIRGVTLYQMSVSAVVCDLAGPFAARLRKKVDVLIFNPPYVPTDEVEVAEATSNRGLESAWAGGSSGMTVTNRLLDQVQVGAIVSN
jgi:hypothetical protein